MKLDKLKIFFVKNKKKTNFCSPSFYNRGIVFFKIITHDGICSLSEPSPYIGDPKIVVKNIEKFFIKHIKNKLINNLNFIDLRKNIKKNTIEFNLIPPFEQSIYVLRSKVERKNIKFFLNKDSKKNKIHLYASGGMIFENKSYDCLIDEALKYKEKGYLGWKFRPKVPITNLSHEERIENPPDFDVKKLLFFCEKIRKKVGDDFNLMIDFGCRIKNFKKTIKLFDALHSLNFLFVEEPFKRKLSKYLEFDQNYKNKIIAAGENFTDYRIFSQFSKIKNVKYIQPDTNLLTFRDLLQIKKLKKKISIHNWCNKINFSMNLNFALSINNEDVILEHNIINSPYNDLFEESYRIKNGYAFLKKDFFELGRLNKNCNKKKFIIYEKKI